MSIQRRLFLALLCCACIIASGVVGYVTIEGYPFFDALYMSIITITTVGFGEIHPLTEQGRIFTTVLILVGLSALGFAGHALAESLLEQAWKNRSGIK
ncbi:MAG: potassium channel family protein, partial [Planctomycetes bacterium]|nr:potassium channel family protein [Planctomycetota bacterium]